MLAKLSGSRYGCKWLHTAMTYQDFLASKSTAAPVAGFDPQQFTAPLFPFQRDIVTMACRVGKFCIWADCGMGKTAMQLEWAHQVHQETGGNVLVLAPLAVAHQTVREGSKFGIPCSFAATQAEVKPGITVTNYEKLGHFDPGSILMVWCLMSPASSRHIRARSATRLLSRSA
jgi:superfamily II DNA or RNA helicase